MDCLGLRRVGQDLVTDFHFHYPVVFLRVIFFIFILTDRLFCVFNFWLRRFPGEGIVNPFQYSWASLVAQMVKNLPAMWETWV